MTNACRRPRIPVGNRPQSVVPPDIMDVIQVISVATRYLNTPLWALNHLQSQMPPPVGIDLKAMRGWVQHFTILAVWCLYTQRIVPSRHSGARSRMTVRLLYWDMLARQYPRVLSDVYGDAPRCKLYDSQRQIIHACHMGTIYRRSHHTTRSECFQKDTSLPMYMYLAFSLVCNTLLYKTTKLRDSHHGPITKPQNTTLYLVSTNQREILL